MIFLLGSGASHPDMPSTTDITTRVLSGDDVFRHSDTCYYFGSPPFIDRETDENVTCIVKLIHLVRSICESYYSDQYGSETNYEDYYYVLSQIADSELREFDNPAVQPLIDELRLHVGQILTPPHGPGTMMLRFENIFQESANYIEDVSRHLLNQQPTGLDDHLQYLKDAIAGDAAIDIYTLNHDTIIEQTFSQNRIEFIDGYGDKEGELRYWQPERFDSAESTTRLFKLHGSIDWYRITGDNSAQWHIAQLSSQAPFHISGANEERLLAPSGRPLMLLGTFNKMLLYTAGLYGDLHCHFHQSLSHKSVIVVCGYGFRDKGINTKIGQWLTANRERRLVVIHHRPTSLFAQARGLIANNWQSWQSNGQLIIIESQSQDVSWEDIQNAIA